MRHMPNFEASGRNVRGSGIALVLVDLKQEQSSNIQNLILKRPIKRQKLGFQYSVKVQGTQPPAQYVKTDGLQR